MELLQKFAAVEIQADHRITELDKEYCEKHQKAYETAISGFKELAFFWEDMNRAQQELLGEKGTPYFHDYLTSRGGPEVSQQSIERHIETLHSDFVTTLVQFFNGAYHVSVDAYEVLDAVLPEKPADRWQENYTEPWEKYYEQMQSLVVRYQDVVDQIILRLDGRSFSEQAFSELHAKCQSAAWNSYERKAKYERKKDTIRFTGYFCRFRGWPYDGWELIDGMKDILRGVAHYETGAYNVFPLGFSCVTSYQEIKDDMVEFPTCEKVKQMKLFKNNRVDVKFSAPEYAEEFINRYLGTVCEVV